MEIQKDILLAPYTTFFIGGPAKYFGVVKNVEDLKQGLEFAEQNNLDLFMLSGGSNVLVSDEGFNGLVLKLENLGIEVTEENEYFQEWKVASGEVWDSVVAKAVKEGLWGIENLSHIPGKMGGFAVQNVGAYGQDASGVVQRLEVYDTKENKVIEITNECCKFGYRSSIFNSELKGRFIIISTTIRLSKIPNPKLFYKDLDVLFSGKSPTLQEIRNAVIEIRNKKFPVPDVPTHGNAGSCFKNPTVTLEQFNFIEQQIYQIGDNALIAKFKDIKERSKGVNAVKVPAAFLLEAAGLKGLEYGGAKINPTQPLVILNFSGHATAADVLAIMDTVITKVSELFGLTLQIEPNLIGF